MQYKDESWKEMITYEQTLAEEVVDLCLNCCSAQWHSLVTWPRRSGHGLMLYLTVRVFWESELRFEFQTCLC